MDLLNRVCCFINLKSFFNLYQVCFASSSSILIENAGSGMPHLRDSAFRMQNVLMAILLYLGGGQRLQVYANILVKDLVWKDGKMYLRVPAEKVPRLHGTLLPLPRQLYTMLEFFKQNVRPHLLHSAEDNEDMDRSLWINLQGGAMSSPIFSELITRLFAEFNPDLHITPIDFRRNTVTRLYSGTVN